MVIKSYLAWPKSGQQDSLVERLNLLDGVEANPAKEHNLVAIVTESESNDQDDQLSESLENLEELQALSLVFASGDHLS